MLKQGGIFSPISREGSLILNNLFLTAACAAVFIGTLYPLALEALTGEKISVGAPFFNLTFGPLMVPLLIALPLGPLLAWKRGDLLAACERLYVALGLTLLATLFVFWLWGMDRVLAPLGVGLAVWVMAGAVAEIISRSRILEVGLVRGLPRLLGLPRSAWGTVLGHFGIGMTVLGIVTASAFQIEVVRNAKPGDTFDVSGYQLTFDGIAPQQGPNFTSQVGHFTVREGGREVARLDPSKRVYTARGMPTTEAAIATFGFSQLYVSLGESHADGSVDLRAYHKPLITLIWLGTLVMSLGGAVSLTDRRLRVGAPKPAKAKSGKQQTVAAE